MDNKHVSAVIGCGYWGPNIARNLDLITDLKYVYDKDYDRAVDISSDLNSAIPADSLEDILEDDEVDMVAIVTPPSTHKELLEKSLFANKHVFVEKPLAHTVEDAKYMADLAVDFPYSTCCVGHTFLFVPEVVELKRLIKAGKIGEVQSINIYRMNFGKYQSCGVFSDLLPHDVSIMNFLIDSVAKPDQRLGLMYYGIPAIGASVFSFSNNKAKGIAFSSWLHTEKTRKITVVGTQGTLEFDMNEPHFLRYWDGRDISVNNPGTYVKLEVKDHSEALYNELRHWIYLIDHPGDSNIISFEHGLDVVRAIGGGKNE